MKMNVLQSLEETSLAVAVSVPLIPIPSEYFFEGLSKQNDGDLNETDDSYMGESDDENGTNSYLITKPNKVAQYI